MPEANRVDVILFDLDGTLVDSREDIVSAVDHTLQQLGLDKKSFEEIVSYIGTGVTDLIRQAVGEENKDAIDKGVDIFTDYFGEHYADKSVLFPHVHEVLEHFKDKRSMVATNRRTSMTKATLRKFGIEKYFCKLIGGDDDDCLKPSSCPVDKALSGNINEGEKAIMVGDMALDVMAGKEAGILTCGVTYGIGKRDDLEKAGPDHLIDDLIQLKDIVK